MATQFKSRTNGDRENCRGLWVFCTAKTQDE